MVSLVWRVLPLLALLFSLIIFYLKDSHRTQLSPLIKVPQSTLILSFFLFFNVFHFMIMSATPTWLCIFVAQLAGDECSLLPYGYYWISSKRIVTPQGIISGSGFSFLILNHFIIIFFSLFCLSLWDCKGLIEFVHIFVNHGQWR